MHDEIEQVSAALTPGRLPQAAIKKPPDTPLAFLPLSSRKTMPGNSKGVSDSLPCSPRLAVTPGRWPQAAIMKPRETPLASLPFGSSRKPMPGNLKGVSDSLPCSPRLAVANEVLEHEPISSHSRQVHIDVGTYAQLGLSGTNAPAPQSCLSGGNLGMEVPTTPHSQRPSLESEIASVSSGTASSYNIAGMWQRTRKGWMMKRLTAEQRGHWHLENSIPSGRGDIGRTAPGASAVPDTSL